MNKYLTQLNALIDRKKQNTPLRLIKNTRIKSSIVCTFMLMTGQAYSADKSIATEQNLINQCSACHSKDMVNSINIYPVLQGQKKSYLIEQLHKFRDGVRKDPIMSVQASQLSDEDIEVIANYFSTQEFTRQAQKDIDELGMNVRARCISCHGLSGHTVNDEWPNLQGQNSSYIFNQLQAFSSGKRDSITMHEIATELTQEQMKAVANYYEQQGREK